MANTPLRVPDRVSKTKTERGQPDINWQNFIRDLTRRVNQLDVAALNDWLTAVNQLTAAANKVLVATGAGSAEFKDISTLAQILLALGGEADWRSELGLAIGSDVQAYDADLAALAAIAGTSGDIIYHNGTQWTDLAVGSNDQVLTLASGLPSWATQRLMGGWTLNASAAQTLSDSTTTTLTQWGTEVIDTLGIIDVSGGAITNIPTPTGATHALVTLGLDWASNSTGIRVPQIGVTSTVKAAATNTAFGSSFSDITAPFLAITGGTDTIYARGFQSSGGNLDIDSGTFTYLSAIFFAL